MTTKQSFEIIINGDNFDLTQLIDRINFYHIKGDLSDEDRTELIEMARERAGETITVNTKTEILQIWARIAEIETRVTALENEGGDTPVDPDEEWPEYVQPTGAHDAYQIGAKITYNNKHYICIMSNCIWSPDVYPQGWQEQT